MGPNEAERIKHDIERVIAENGIDLTDDLIDKMPSIPDVSKAGKINSRMENIALSDSRFATCQVVHTETSFIHFGIAISIGGLPEKLRKYLVLFQELMFQSHMETDAGVIMDYKEVSKYASGLFVSHECGVGFGNSLFGVSYLSQVITLFATVGTRDWDKGLRFLIRVVMFTKFSKKRILSLGKPCKTNKMQQRT